MSRLRHRPVVLLIVLLGAAVQPAIARGRAMISAQTTGPRDPLPSGPGKDALETVCGVCHEVDTAIGTRRSAAEWELVIDAMINRGAIGSEDEYMEIFAYLTKHFIVVNVNTAEGQEIEKTLEVTSAVAEAIVRHRTENGPFETLDDLKKVPGLDGKTVDERKLRVAFK